MKALLYSRILHITLLLMLLIAGVGLSFSNARWRAQLRNYTFDTYNIVKPRTPSDNIAIIDIDEASLAAIGQMPWPRSIMADLVTRLKAMGAALTVFDIVFAEPDRISPRAMAEHLQHMKGFEDIRPRLEQLPDNDTAFGLAIGQAGNVVTGFSFTNDKTPSTPRQKGLYRGKHSERFVTNLRGASANLKHISKFAAGNGSFFVSADSDGIIRRVPMLVAHAKPGSTVVSTYPSLSLEAMRVLDGERGGRVVLADQQYAMLDPSRFGIEGIQIGKGGRFIPTNARGEFLVYFAKANPEWYIPAHTILDGSYPAERLKDKIVLVGTSAVGLKDIRSTPLDAFRPGVEVHLNIIDQIVHNTFLYRSIEAEGIEAITVFLAGLIIILIMPFVGALVQAAMVTTIITGLMAGGWYGFVHYGWLIDVVYPSLVLIVIFMLSTILTYMRSEQGRRQVRSAFGLYISPDFMTELTENPDKLKLGGEIKDLSVMFTDIRRFTTISEGMPPEDLIQLMNDFLTPISDLVMQNRGTIDKYMGDAMMAFWNAPLDVDDHARLACQTALSMQGALAPINEAIISRAQSAGQEPVLLEAGIGINTGECAVGNMGSRQRFAYSALGDAVNLASRLEGQTKSYGVGILIGEQTYRQADDFAALELDILRVKGKAKPERVFALLGDPEQAKSAQFIEWSAQHQKMLEAYRAQNFEQVIEYAAQCEALSTIDLSKVYTLYKQRAGNLIKNPPAENWDGVFEAIEK